MPPLANKMSLCIKDQVIIQVTFVQNNKYLLFFHIFSLFFVVTFWRYILPYFPQVSLQMNNN